MNREVFARHPRREDAETLAKDVYDAVHATLDDGHGADDGGAVQGLARERVRRACAAFVSVGLLEHEDAKRGDDAMSVNGGIDITAILMSYEVSLVEFLDELPEFLNASARSLAVRVKSGSSTVAEIERVLRVREIRSAFAFNKVIAKKFYDFLALHFDVESAIGKATARLGWSLYLCAKCESLPVFPDLYSCFHLLIAVEAFLLTNVPQRALRTTLKNMVSMTAKDEETKLPDPLRSLSAASKTKLETVVKMADAVVKIVCDTFPVAQQDKTKHRDDVAPSDLCVEGVFGSDFGDATADAMSARYRAIAEKAFGRLMVDETMYLYTEMNDMNSVGRKIIGDLSQSWTATTHGSMATPARRQRATPFSPIRPKKIEMVGAGPASPLHGFAFRSSQQIPPSTPITQAITSATWLHDCVCAGGIQAKLEALRAFVPGDAALVNALHKTVEELGQRIGQAIREDALVTTMRTDISPQSSVMDDLVQQRTSEIANVFFYFLNRILSDELERASRTAKDDMNFSSLLKSQRFTKSLLTCAMEVIVSTYKTSTLTFPATPHLLGIHPFDLATIIEPFVRADMSMPREIQRHFNSLEEKTLERLAWCKGSTLFEFLQTYHDSVKDHPNTGPRDTKMEPSSTSSPAPKPSIRKATSKSVLSVGSIAELAAMGGEDTERTHTQDEDEHLPMAQCQSPVRRAPTSAFTAFSSPMRGVTTPSKRRASASGPLPDRFAPVRNHDVSMPDGCDVCAFKALRMFFAKVMHLAARRLSDLCTRLNLTQEIVRNSYVLIEHVVYEQTNLLYNRHLDQIILSAVYGVCKVNSGATQRPTVAFRDIIYQYSKQPQSNEEVFWTVVLEQSDPELEIMRRGDVISFYNTVFVSRVKSFLLTLRKKKRSHDGSMDAEPSNEPLPYGLSSPMRRVPILPNHNIYVSPMRPDRLNAIQTSMPPHTPRSKGLFATIGESAHGFRPSSHAFEAINHAMQSPARADGPRSKIPKFGTS